MNLIRVALCIAGSVFSSNIKSNDAVKIFSSSSAATKNDVGAFPKEIRQIFKCFTQPDSSTKDKCEYSSDLASKLFHSEAELDRVSKSQKAQDSIISLFDSLVDSRIAQIDSMTFCVDSGRALSQKDKESCDKIFENSLPRGGIIINGKIKTIKIRLKSIDTTDYVNKLEPTDTSKSIQNNHSMMASWQILYARKYKAQKRVLLAPSVEDVCPLFDYAKKIDSSFKDFQIYKRIDMLEYLKSVNQFCNNDRLNACKNRVKALEPLLHNFSLERVNEEVNRQSSRCDLTYGVYCSDIKMHGKTGILTYRSKGGEIRNVTAEDIDKDCKAFKSSGLTSADIIIHSILGKRIKLCESAWANGFFWNFDPDLSSSEE